MVLKASDHMSKIFELYALLVCFVCTMYFIIVFCLLGDRMIDLLYPQLSESYAQCYSSMDRYVKCNSKMNRNDLTEERLEKERVTKIQDIRDEATKKLIHNAPGAIFTFLCFVAHIVWYAVRRKRTS